MNKQIKDFAFSVDEGKISVLAQTQDDKIAFTVFTGEEKLHD